jgi:26S proteasome non-ATPase regulatory subunit 9
LTNQKKKLPLEMGTPSLRARFRELTAQKAELEARIEAAAARLNAPGGPGLTAPLVDREGFPRADVGDLAAARRDRHDLACWTNDHKALMKEVEEVVHALMAAGSGGGGEKEEDEPMGEAAAPAPAAAAPAPAAAPSVPTTTTLPPFASVGDVAPCSPAAAAGMQVGDLILRLAGVDAAGPADAPPSPSSSLLERVATALAASENRPCACVVLRAGRRVALELTPRRWAGRGLLGCHLRPLALPAGGGGA